ncbi:glycoside hydrolase family 48 protein [Thermocatellispora tengchongensis]
MAAFLVAAGLAAAPSSPAQAAVACEVTYQKTWDSGGGFGANITIRNIGDPLTGWTLTWTFAGNQRVTNMWNASHTQSAATVTATNAPYNGNLATGASVTVGFNGTYSGTNTNPTSFALNGVTCNGQQQQQALVVTPTSVAVPEGGTATFSVRLQAQPSANVTVTTTAGSGDSNLTVSAGATLTFTPSNWNTAQNVTLAAAEDADNANGARAFTVASSGLTSVTVNATEADNDSTQAQALVVTPTAVSVPEGSTAIYSVRLAAQPSGNVTVTSTAGTGDNDITVSSGASLTFTASNWNTAQNVTLAAAQDSDQANGTRPVTVAATGLTSVTVTATEIDDEAPANSYLTEFTTQYNKIKASASGYFSPEGIPYHSVETLLVEAPDHGHETTSEAFSYWLWLEAMYGRITENWAPFNNAWSVMEQYIIPSAAGQPGGQTTYNPNDPADYAPEFNQPSQYPAPLSSTVTAGQDPLANELQSTYGNRTMYAMHWLLDVDDVYGYGTGRTGAECGDNTQRVTYINTYQRGPQESVWETVPHPSCDTGRFGQSGGGGYPPLFVQGSTAGQWRYTAAPDADARAVQAAYWALTWATEQGNQSQISATVAKAAKMGDFLRYAMYDKYFKNPGCTSPSCPAGTGKSSSAYLLNWYFAWGGDIQNQWSWRIGSSHNHGGYQNPLAAWALSPAGPSALRPLSPTAGADWQQSLTRQVQFYTWLQSDEGAIAGGATNSWDGAYAAPPAGTPTFFGMAYDVDPVYHDPPSNQWFGFQAWGVQRLAELYYVTGNAQAKAVLDKWVAWALSETTLGSGSSYQIPNEMTWSGAPSASFSDPDGTPGPNPNLHVSVRNYTTDVGVAAALARTLIYYAAKEGNTTLGTQARTTAKGLLDRLLLLKDSRGVAVPETRADYNRFDDVWSSSNQQGLYIPSGYSGTMPNGDVIQPGSTFLSIRSFYEDDPDWPKVQEYLDGGEAPTFTYHRFWAQADFAMALADYGTFFPNG